MKKIIFYTILGSLFLGACSTASSPTKPKWRSIDYGAYEHPTVKDSDDYTAKPLPNPSVFGDETNTGTDYTPGADEDFTSDEIASSYGRYTDVTVVAAAKRIKLGSAATTKHMALFQKALDSGYKKALRTYHPSGFTYSIASVGAVNPLSDIEVSCILGEHAANEVGQPTCNLFFSTLVEQYNTLFKEAKANGTL